MNVKSVSRCVVKVIISYLSLLTCVSKAEEVLKVYLDGLASLGQTILAADKSLSEAEQRIKGNTSHTGDAGRAVGGDRKSTRLNSSH